MNDCLGEAVYGVSSGWRNAYFIYKEVFSSAEPKGRERSFSGAFLMPSCPSSVNILT
jgi:hypothetical protein